MDYLDFGIMTKLCEGFNDLQSSTLKIHSNYMYNETSFIT